MVERSLSMREVPGSIPGASIQIFLLTDFFACFVCIKKVLIVSNVDTKYEFWKDCRALFLYFAVNKSRLMLGMNIANNKDTQVKNAKKMSVCNVRESNPGRPRGRRAFYHWTNVAYMLGELEKKAWKRWEEKAFKNVFAVGRIRTYAPRGKLISSQSP